MTITKQKKYKEKLFIFISIFILIATNVLFFSQSSKTESDQSLPYEREFQKNFSLKEKFELSKEYFLYTNSDYSDYFPEITWDEENNFIAMPNKLTLIKNDNNQIIFENKTTFIEEELTFFKLLYELEEEVLHQEQLVANGQEFYDLERYDEITLQINKQAELVDSLLASNNSNSEQDEKEVNSHLLLGLHLLTSQADEFSTFIHEFHQWQSFLVDYTEIMQLYAQIALTDVKVDSKYLEALKETTEEQLSGMFIFYQNPSTYETILLGKLEFETKFDTTSNTLTSHIIFNHNNGQFEEEFLEILNSITTS